MTPLGIVAVAGIGIAFLAYRWVALSRVGAYDGRAEWPYFAVVVGMVAFAGAITLAGRLAMLIMTPVVLIPSGIYLIDRSSTQPVVGGQDLRRLGGMAVIGGVLAGLAAVAALVVG